MTTTQYVSLSVINSYEQVVNQSRHIVEQWAAMSASERSDRLERLHQANLVFQREAGRLGGSASHRSADHQSYEELQANVECLGTLTVLVRDVQASISEVIDLALPCVSTRVH